MENMRRQLEATVFEKDESNEEDEPAALGWKTTEAAVRKEDISTTTR